ncbi:MAG: inositol monophosphatase family protein [Thermoplasmatales archaeon]|nr:inositol monophosphatase family protein [Thermoplasmatales archaeon]
MKKLLRDIAENIAIVVNENIGNPGIGKTIRNGADGTPTKMIDEIAEKAALAAVKASGEKVNILSEEAGFINNGGGKTIVLDPVDGTFNAVHHIPFYAVSIAVGTKTLSDVEYGVVRNLVNNDMFEAEKGKGAFLNNKRIKTKNFDEKNHTFSVYLGRKASAKSYEISRQARRVRSMGCASLDLCMVANGSTDLYYQMGYPIRITDIAAGVLILREAGGEVYGENKEILDMGFNLKERKNFVAVGDRKCLEVIL